MSVPPLKKDLVLKVISGLDFDEIKRRKQEFADASKCTPQYVMKVAKQTQKEDPLVIRRSPHPEDDGIEKELAAIAQDDALILPSKDDADDWAEWFDEDPPKGETEVDGHKIPEPPKAPPLEEVFFQEDAGVILDIVFDMIAEFADFEGFRLSAIDKKKLTPLTHRMMKKYFDTLLDKYVLEAMFAIALLGVVSPKIKQYRDHAERARIKFELEEQRLQTEQIRSEREALSAESDRLEALRRHQGETDAKEHPKIDKKEDAGQPDWNQEK